MNKAILIGRLTRDPDVRYSQTDSNMAIARFSLAVDRRYKKQGDETTADFFNCTAFGKQGEFVEKYIKKGTKVVVTGRIQNDNYTNKEGQKVYSVQIMVEEIEFAESKANAEQRGQEDNNMPPAIGEPGADGFMDIPDGIPNSLPFN